MLFPLLSSSQKKVLFVHRGVSFGRFVLFVSDGKHYVSTLLEVIIMSSHFMYFRVLFIYFIYISKGKRY